MGLGDVKNKLYKKETEKDLSRHDESEYDPRVAFGTQDTSSAGDLWAKKESGLDVEEKTAVKRGAWALGIILGIIFLVVVGYLIKASLFSDSRVKVAVSGLEDISSGKLLTYEINYENNNSVSLKNVSLKITYPESFKPDNNPNFNNEGLTASILSIGNLPAHGKGKAVFNGRIYSPRGALIYLKAELVYSPSSVSSRFISTNQLGVNVSSSPLALEIMAPQNVASGDEINYAISYKNTGPDDSSNLRLRVEYPEGFTFSDSSPKVSEGNNIWYIGRLSSGQEGKINISGKLEGERDNSKVVKISLGTFEENNFISYNDEQATTAIVASPLFITQSVNGANSSVVSPGDKLHFSIFFRNDGNIGLKDIIVTEKIESEALEYSSLQTDGGFYDGDKKTITWKSSDHPVLKSLEPGKSGNIDFNVKVKDIIPMNSLNDRNYVISSIVKIDSLDIPTPIHMNKIIAGNKMDMKLNSKLVLDVAGYYNDDKISNSGPVPPKVGEETTYTLHWILRNTTNDMSDVKVEAVLPTGVTMAGQIYPEEAKITYNERNNSIIWEVGNISAGVGIISNSSPREAVFQVKIKPSVNQVGNPVTLLNQSVASGKDLFTGMSLSSTASGKTTDLGEDQEIRGKYNVVN